MQDEKEREKGLLDRVLKFVSIFSFAMLAFIAGIAVSYLKLAPYQWAVAAWMDVRDQLGEPDRLMPAVHDFEGVRIHDRQAMAAGTTFITSYFPETDWNAGARLIDADGNVLHVWHVDAKEIFGTRIRRPYIHGSHLFPNGDILANFEFVGLARISACGEVLWSISDPRPHHSISAAPDGTFWVSGNRILESRGDRPERIFAMLSMPVYEDLFMQVSADGEILKTISSLEVFEKNGLAEDMLRTARRFNGDIFHLNDVDVLSPEMADEYPLFEAGDIAVSLRDMHLVAILDPDTLEVKWHSYSDTLSQHDVDFIGGGWIGIFDNRFDRTERGAVLGGSRIVAIKPDTEERRILFPTEASPPFYTKWSGKWQQLDNGNMLLTEARAGRALEVTAGGEPVWEWVIEHFDADHVPEVMEATRYPITPRQAAAWSRQCSG